MFYVFVPLENTLFRTSSSLQKTAYRLTNPNQFEFEHYKPKNQTFADSQQLCETANTPYTDAQEKHVQGNISPHFQIKYEYYNCAPLYSNETSAPALLQTLRSSMHFSILCTFRTSFTSALLFPSLLFVSLLFTTLPFMYPLSHFHNPLVSPFLLSPPLLFTSVPPSLHFPT